MTQTPKKDNDDLHRRIDTKIDKKNQKNDKKLNVEKKKIFKDRGSETECETDCTEEIKKKPKKRNMEGKAVKEIKMRKTRKTNLNKRGQSSETESEDGCVIPYADSSNDSRWAEVPLTASWYGTKQTTIRHQAVFSAIDMFTRIVGRIDRQR